MGLWHELFGNPELNRARAELDTEREISNKMRVELEHANRVIESQGQQTLRSNEDHGKEVQRLQGCIDGITKARDKWQAEAEGIQQSMVGRDNAHAKDVRLLGLRLEFHRIGGEVYRSLIRHLSQRLRDEEQIYQENTHEWRLKAEGLEAERDQVQNRIKQLEGHLEQEQTCMIEGLSHDAAVQRVGELEVELQGTKDSWGAEVDRLNNEKDEVRAELVAAKGKVADQERTIERQEGRIRGLIDRVERAERNDMPHDPDTGRFVSRNG